MVLTNISGNDLFAQCANLIQQADSLLITAGAGIGVDSGLPDFRGPKGFWGVYPALGRAGLHFEDIANPQAFRDNPRLAWGFYGHRLNLYRKTEPSQVFSILKRIASVMERGAFIFTSNVDGQFQKSGFSAAQLCEVHGSIHHLQCTEDCEGEIWSARDFNPEVDEAKCLLKSQLPVCPHCGALARPNILMFGDAEWLPWRYVEQKAELDLWKIDRRRGVVIEIGAGTAIPSVRLFSENQGWPLIRINPTEPDVKLLGSISLKMGGSEALLGILSALEMRGYFDELPDQCADKDDEYDLEALSAIVDEEQKAEQAILRGLGFDWRHSPRIEHGLISGHPITGPVTMTFTLPTGRLIKLKRLYQFDVYGGMLAGMPNDPERHLIQAVKVAKQYFPDHGMMPVVLEPVFHAGHVTRKKRDGGEIPVPWLKLPEVCTVAEFDSNEPARGEDEIYSSVLAIWFQDHYGLPDDAQTLEQLKHLDWEKCGYDWTP